MTAGLSPEEAAQRLTTFGPNELVPQRRRNSIFGLIFTLVADPMVVLLLVTGITYLVLGDRFDAAVAFSALVPIFLINAVLEQRSERALEQLRKLSAPTVRVRRGSAEIVIDARVIVPGDVVLVQEGDIIAADGELCEGRRLLIDESALTGESQPVSKSATGVDEERIVLAGTTLLSGHGEVRITQTGARTQYGRIGTLMSQIHAGRTPIETTIRRLVMQIGGVVLLICGVVVFIEHARGALWPVAVIAGVSLAMAALPEELPMVYTLYLALGAWRLAKDKALARRLSSVETLGSISVICVDKTGTLTEGKLEIAEVFVVDGKTEQIVIDAAASASESAGHDPLDAAVLRYAKAHVPFDTPARTLVNEYPFDPSTRYAAKVWRTQQGHQVALKGGVEAVLQLCAVDDTQRVLILAKNQELASRGMRVIAVAGSNSDATAPPNFLTAKSLGFFGLLAFGDPIRPNVPRLWPSAVWRGFASS